MRSADATGRQRATPRGLVAAATLLFVSAVAAWEGATALRAPGLVPSEADWQAAEREVRAGFAPTDLIVFSPSWIAPLGRRQLGDLMPLSMIGRPDDARYGRVWEVSARGARAPETSGLAAELTRRHGQLTVTRYPRSPITVTYDLVAQLLAARVVQAPIGAPTTEAERPCLWAGPPPATPPPRGEAGAFVCSGSRVERRVMEIDYQPRYGVVVPVEAGRRTVIEYADIPAAAWQGADLVMWFGLHDYYARKTDSGPVDVVIDLDHGQRRVPVSVAPSGWLKVTVAPPPGAGPHLLLIEVSARDARARNLGFAGEVRR